MIIRALLPKLTPKTVKEKIIVILSTDYPLTIKELKKCIKKNFNQSVSYQSVHKELNRLLKEEIIVQKSKKYMLNIDWIRQVGLFSDLILSNYTHEKKHSINKLLELKNDGDSLSFEFECFAEVDRYFFELLDYYNEFFDPKKTILMHSPHSWWPLLYPFREQKVMNKLQSDFIFFCSSNTPIDQYCIAYSRKIGLKAMHSNNPKIQWNVNLFGDLIFTLYVDPKVNQEVHIFFEKHTDWHNMDLKKLAELVQKKGRFRVLVVKDSVMAENVLATELPIINQKVEAT